MSEATEFHPMREPQIEKVVVHMGVGRGGMELQQAEEILEDITGHQSVRTQAKSTIPEFGTREGDPIGAKVTLRGNDARSFLETAFDLTSVSRSQFDDTGNVSFGIDEHTDFPGQEYNPDIGIYGLDVTITLVRPGYRVRKRDKQSRSIPGGHRLTIEDAISYLEREFDVEVQ